MDEKKPIDWPTAAVLVALFAAVTGMTWALAWMVR